MQSEALERSEQPKSRSLRGILAVMLWILVLLLVGCIVVVRLRAPDRDFAVANLQTVGLALVIWLLSVVALFLSRSPRSVFHFAVWGPVVILIAFFVRYEFERVDGELRPQFRLRSESASELPGARAKMAVSADFAAPRSTDFPQFLGPNRNATIGDINLDPVWNQESPKIAWKQPIGDGWSGFAVQGDLAITMEQRGASEWVSAYSIINGELLWKYEIEARHTNIMGGTGPRVTPSIAGGRVFACSAVSAIVCLDLLTGVKIWSRELLELSDTSQDQFEASVAWGRSGSPLVVDETVFIPLGGTPGSAQAMIALDAETGEEHWRAGDDQVSYSSPVLVRLADVEQILLVSEKRLGAYLPESGEQIWSFPWDGHSNSDASVSQPVVLDGDRILMTKGYHKGAQLVQVSRTDDHWETNLDWQLEKALRTKLTSCVAKDGYAYGLSDGILECVDLKTGKRKWKRGRYRQGQLLLVGQHLLISSESGELVLVSANPDEFVELARMPVIGDVTWNTLTLSGNRLLIRNSDEAACVILPTLAPTETID